ncbi:hypothetical protein INR49_017322 [Caranx melampygus]|nr:hypothetical protein INR49_017322 [Caranx melampygus]
MMNDREERQAECGADGVMYVRRRSLQSRPAHQATTFTLLPPRPLSHGDARPLSTGPVSLGLQVQGFCCPLRQRPTSGGVMPQSRGGGDGGPILLNSVRARVESRAEPASRARTGISSVMNPEGGGLTVGQASETAVSVIALWKSSGDKNSHNPCNIERRAPRGRSSTAKVSQLHLYLPSSSSLCEDEDEESEMEEMRSASRVSAGKTSEAQPNISVSTAPGTLLSPSDDITLQDTEQS